MTNSPVRILYLEDDPRDAELVRDKLQAGMVCELRIATDRGEYEAALAQTRFDLILSDYSLPDYDGMAALALARKKQPDVPFILISGTLGEERAVDCVLRGATDFVLKQRLNRLVPAVARALAEAEELQKCRAAEAALRASEAKYRDLFESTLDAIITLEPPSWKFTAVNPAAVKMFGAENEVEFISHAPWELSPEQQPDGRASAEKAKEMIETAVREGSYFFEWTHRRIGGEEFPADVLLTRLEQGGKVILQSTVRNITERKRREDALVLAKDAAEAANRAKTEFLHLMSHELRTPMTAILGFSELLMMPDPLAQEQQRQYLGLIQSNGEALLRILNDLLDLARIEAERLVVDQTDCPLQQIIDEVLAMVTIRAVAKGLHLQVVRALPLPEHIRTDPGRLRQILVNLLGNAVKFTERGEVCLTVRCLAEGDRPPRLQFAISDTGIGIPAAKLGELFQPFMQVDTSSTRRYGGTGLGLAISQRLAQRLDGEIQVSSEVGRGSTFTLTIAVGPRPEPAAPPEDRAARTGEPAPALHGRVLFVEDEPCNQLVVRELLRKLHLEVEIAGDGQMACQMAEHSQAEGRPYDLILMDIQLPRMDGYEVTGWLRRHGWQGPIVALTAHAMAGDREKCLAAGCDAYLSKPISLTALREALARYLGQAAPDASPPSDERQE